MRTARALRRSPPPGAEAAFSQALPPLSASSPSHVARPRNPRPVSGRQGLSLKIGDFGFARELSYGMAGDGMEGSLELAQSFLLSPIYGSPEVLRCDPEHVYTMRRDAAAAGAGAGARGATSAEDGHRRGYRAEVT